MKNQSAKEVISLYDILEIGEDADETDIRKAYRKKVRQYPPEVPDNAEEFKKIQLAYEVLSEPSRRKLYDETGEIQEDTKVERVVIPILQEAMSMVIVDLMKYGMRLCHTDMVELMKAKIKEYQDSAKQDVESADKLIKELQETLEKYKTKNAINLLKEITKQKIDLVKEQQQLAKDAITEFDLTLKILEDYRFGDRKLSIQGYGNREFKRLFSLGDT